MTSSLSVTKIRVAFECPRLFYLGEKFPGPTMFQPKDTVTGIGQAFHKLCETSVELILKNPEFQALFNPPNLDAQTTAQELEKLLYKHAFYPELLQVAQSDPKKVAAYQKLWQGLTGLIQHWGKLLASNRQFCNATDVASRTFLAKELKLAHTFTLPNGTQQLVQGKFDSLIYDFSQQRLCVADYKTYQTQDASATLAQVALYGYMLRQKVGVPINSAVYSVLPDWKEQSFQWDQLESTVHQLIPQRLQQMQTWLQWQPGQPNPVPATAQPSLCGICPKRSKCREMFGATAADLAPDPIPQPTNSPHHPITPLPHHPTIPPPPNNNVADETANQLIQVLSAFNIGVDYAGSAIGPAFIRVKLKPHPGIKIASILKLSDDLRVQMGLHNAPMIAPQAGYLSVDLPRPDRQTAHFQDYIQRQNTPPTEPVKIAIGVNLDGHLVEADLSDPNTCHFLVGGTTGSGKSEFLRSLLLSLLTRHSPNHLKIVLVDPKRVTFPEFETIPWLYQPIVKDSEAAIELMESLVDEMERRYRRFEQAQCSDLKGYNAKAEPLPRIVCIFDEYADFMAEKSVATALEQSIKRLGAMARAAGIHLIIATQRPEAKVVTPLIRSNLPGRVALRTASSADSSIILGGKEEAAAQLLGKGDLLYLGGGQLMRLQSLFASQIEAQQIRRLG